MQDSIRMYHQEERLYPIGSNDSIKSINSISDIESKLPMLFISIYIFFGMVVLMFSIFET